MAELPEVDDAAVAVDAGAVPDEALDATLTAPLATEALTE